MTVHDLEQLGGSRWEKEGQRRVYFNNLGRWLPPMAGLTEEQARKERARLSGAKLWWDDHSQTFSGSGLTDEEARYAIQKIGVAVAELGEQTALF